MFKQVTPWFELGQLEMDATLEGIREGQVRLGFREPGYWDKEVVS